MKKQAAIGGRSLIFNLLFVQLNFTGLVFIICGSHPANENYFLLFNFIGYITVFLSIGGLVLFQGKLLMANVSRWLVGSLFIFSGIIKLNDPVGFALKLEEYFQDGALAFRIKELFNSPGFSLEFFQDYSFFIALVLTIAELILGVFLIIGGKVRAVAFYLLGLLLFFTTLTWHSATCDPKTTYWDENTYEMASSRAQVILSNYKNDASLKIIEKKANELVVQEKKKTQCVDDCGCFGDALKGSIGRSLIPLESFFKDVILIYLAVWIFLARKQILPNTRNQNIQFLLAFLSVAIFLSIIFNWYFPIIFSIILILGSLWIRRSGGVVFGNYFGSVIFILISSLITLIYVLRYDPIKDFRPFAVGNNLSQEMNNGKAGLYSIEYKIKNLKTNVRQVISQKEYTDNSQFWDTSKYIILGQNQKEIKPEIPPSLGMQFNPILDIETISKRELQLPAITSFLSYGIGQNPNSFRDVMVKLDKVILLVIQDIKCDNISNFKNFKPIIDYCQKNKIPIYLITRCSLEEQTNFKKKFDVDIVVLQNYDENGLKMISRSDPSMLVLRKGIVKGKFTSNDIPEIEDLKTILTE